jgi:hypothetical protein
VVASNALAAGWGAIAWLRKDARGTLVFWPLLRVAQAVVVAEVVVGLVLVARGETARDGLHVAYGIAPLLITLVSEGMRAGVAQRELDDVADVEALERPKQVALARRIALGEMGVMTVGALLILTLALRAFQTGG